MSFNVISTAGFSDIIHYAFIKKRIFEYSIRKTVTPFPSAFCIQTINLCNGSCIICPFVKNSNMRAMVMQDELF